MAKITLERVVVRDILQYILTCHKNNESEEQLVSGLEEILREYADNWASDNAKDWLIDHHP